MSIPKGYKLVPVEPTDEMLEVLHGSVKIQVDTWERTADIINDKEWWSSVVDSAPTPPQPTYDEAKERELFERQTNIVDGIFYSVDHKCYRPINGRAVEHSDALDETLRLQGWLACAQSRAKAGEVGHE